MTKTREVVLPDISEIPIELLEAHVARVKAERERAAAQGIPDVTIPKKHSGYNFRVFYGKFNEIQEEGRSRRFQGMGSNGDEPGEP